MKLISLKLCNIRSHKDTKLDFSESLLLVGDIGAGKSTILQAIEFALFGIQRGFLDASHILRQGEDEGNISLVFSLKDSTIEIGRTLKKKRSSIIQGVGYISIDGEKELCAPTELTSKVAFILGYPTNVSQVFRYSVYATQEQMKSIILEKPDQRLNTLRIIFNIDKYKHIIENSALVLRNLRKDIAYLEGSYSDLTSKKLSLAELKARINDLTQTNLSLSKSAAAEKEVLARKENQILELKSKVDEILLREQDLSSKKEQLVSLNKEIESISANKLNLDKEIQNLIEERSQIIIPQSDLSLEEVSTKESDLRSLLERNRQLKISLTEKVNSENNSIKLLSSDLDDSSAEKLSVLKASLEKTTAEINKVKLTLYRKAEVESKLTSLKVNKSSNSSKITDLKQELNSINSLDSCPTCKQEVSASHKTNIEKKLSDKINLLEKEIDPISYSQLEQDLNQITEAEKSNLSLQKDLSSLTQQITHLEDKIKSQTEKSLLLVEHKTNLEKLNKKLFIVSEFDEESSKSQLIEFEKQLDSLRQIELIKQKKNSLHKLSVEKQGQLSLLSNTLTEKKELQTSITSAITQLELNLKFSATIKETYEKENSDLIQVREAYNQSRIKLESSEKELALLTSQLKTLESEVSEKMLSKQKADWNKHLKSWLTNFYVPLIKAIEKRVLTQIYSEFNKVFKEWFNLLLEDEAITAEVDETFTPKIYQNGYDLDINSLSGGERTSVALSYRLTLNKIVNQLLTLKTKDLLILDEPTEGFSSEQLDRVKYVLDELNIPQLILVSHEAKVGSFVNQVLTVEKHNSESKVV